MSTISPTSPARGATDMWIPGTRHFRCSGSAGAISAGHGAIPNVGLPEQASACCLGILQGIYDFDRDSSTQYKEWAVEAPKEYFGQVADAWQNIYHGKPPLSKLDSSVRNTAPTTPSGSRGTCARGRGDLSGRKLKTRTVCPRGTTSQKAVQCQCARRVRARHRDARPGTEARNRLQL
jgi:hypothetical protein